MSLLQTYLRSPRTQRILNRKPKDKGFSLIELVIVVAILAILAAIGIPAFNDAQVRAREASAKTGLATAYKECAVSRLLGAASHTILVSGGGVTYAGEALLTTCAATVAADLARANAEGGNHYRINLVDGAKSTSVDGGANWINDWQ